MKRYIYYIALCWILAGCGEDAAAPKRATDIPAITYKVLRSLPHDTTSFTEGLLFHNGRLFESTGSPANQPQLQSVAGPLDTATGKINARIKLDSRKYFGEGIVFLNNKLFQLTYLNKVGFVYDANTFQLIDSFAINSNEGWGLTTDGTHIIMSDGTANLSYIDPVTYKVGKILRVTNDDGTVDRLNELEYVQGFMYANIYTTSTIVKIDIATGRVVARIDLSQLEQKAREKYRDAAETNGIAYYAATGSFFVTGKLWPEIYEISFPH